MKTGRAAHLIVALALFLGIGIVYTKVTGAYFCSYDDFVEVHRAAFEDTREPSKMFKTPDFNSYKYRPLNRMATFVTYSLGGGDPLIFRVRNLVFHLANVVLVYTLGWLLLRSKRISGIGALLFGLHPMANQATIGAVWPITIAYFLFLLAIILVILAVQREELPWLIAGAVSGWLSVFTYDTAITVLGLMCIYLILRLLGPGEAVGRRFILVFGGVSTAFLLTYFLLRGLFVPRGWEQVATSVPSVAIVMKNLAMYIAALLSPIDFVLANEWLDTPLPSEIVARRAFVVFWSGAVIAVVATLSGWLWGAKRLWEEIDWRPVVFLVCGILLPLSPVLAFAAHPSETYLYGSAAFYALLLSTMLAGLFAKLGGRLRDAGYPVSVLLLLVSYGAATWVRNDRVAECGHTASRILERLPAELVGGEWKIMFANVPDEPLTRRYGFYGFRGIDTIGHEPMADRAVTAALQLHYGNELLSGAVVAPVDLVDKCRRNATSRGLCMWVHWDGRVESVD